MNTPVLAVIEALRQRHIEALERRAAGQPAAVQLLVQARLQQLRTAPSPAPTAPRPVARGEPLADLLAHIAQHSGAASTAELKAVRDYRSTWSRLGVQRRLTQSSTQVPRNAGPLNTQRLLHEALTVLNDTAPAYLQRLVQQVEALLWLEQLNQPAVVVAKAAAPKKARQRLRREPQAQVELELVVVRLHVFAQRIEGTAVFALFQVRELVHDDHAQQIGRRLLEQRGNADLAFGLELATLHP